MEYLSPYIKDVVAQQNESAKEKIQVVEMIFNVNKETCENIFNRIDKILENNTKFKTSFIKKSFMLASKTRILNFGSIKTLYEMIHKKHSTIVVNLREAEFYDSDHDKFKAIMNDDVDSLQKIIGVESNDYIFCDDLLHSEHRIIGFSALLGSIKCFKYLLMNDAEFHESYCADAIAGGCIEIIKIIQQKDFQFKKCLSVSIVYHRHEIFEWLYNNFNDEKNINLTICLENVNDAALYFLCSDPEHLYCGTDSLVWSILYNDMEIFNYLISKREGINGYDSRKRSPLIVAIKNKMFDCAKKLIDNGADIKAVDHKGRDVFNVALMSGCKEIIDILISKGEMHKVTRIRATILLLSAAKGNSKEIVEKLIDSGAYVNARDSRKRTALHIAAKHNAFDAAKILIDRGADPDCEDSFNHFPLSYAIKNYDKGFDLIKLLVEKSSDINIMNKDGSTILHRAAFYAEPEVVLYLISQGADVNAKNDKNQTPLHAAVLGLKYENTKILVKAGCKLNVRDALGRTPLSIARQRDYEDEFIDLLENKK